MKLKRFIVLRTDSDVRGAARWCVLDRHTHHIIENFTCRGNARARAREMNDLQERKDRP